MVLYELTHNFYRYGGEIVYSPKFLGLFMSHQCAQEAISFYKAQPGFSDNLDAFSIRHRNVIGHVIDGTVYEALIYLHSVDYSFEAEFELGLCADKSTAHGMVAQYMNENNSLLPGDDIFVEEIINTCIIDQLDWREGFSICEND